MKKFRIVIIGLILVLVASVFIFADSKLNADRLYALKLFEGMGTDENGLPVYSLESVPTRNQALVMLIRLIGKEDEALNGTWEHPFVDTVEWADKYIGYAFEHALTDGVDDTHFDGEAHVTASQYITFVLRALGYKDNEDFIWNESYMLSNALGITNGEYNDKSKTFLRSDVVDISYNSLRFNVKGSETSLCEIATGNKYGLYELLTPETAGLPLLNITGDLSEISKENKVKVEAEYKGDEEFKTYATLKLQGASTLYYPKKNYNIQFFKADDYDKKFKVELQDGWGKESKYCLKANWVDWTQSRNVVNAKLWKQIVDTRTDENNYSNLPGGAAIDGYPILLYINGVFNGVYTLNIPKDKWMVGMDNGNEQLEAALCLDSETTATCFQTHISSDKLNGWEVEYCTTEDEEGGLEWVVDSLNGLTDFLMAEHTKDEFREGIEKRVDVNSVIDYVIYCDLARAWDNIGHNAIFTTYDGGKTWGVSPYDIEWSWGYESIAPDGTGILNEPDEYGFDKYTNKLFLQIIHYYQEELIERYNELRQSVLSEESILALYENFIRQIPEEVYEADLNKWPTLPAKNENSIDQIKSWLPVRLEWFDEYLKEQFQGSFSEENMYHRLFTPQQAIATILYRIVEDEKIDFETEDYWLDDMVEWAKETGYINDEMMSQGITRAQFISMLYKATAASEKFDTQITKAMREKIYGASDYSEIKAEDVDALAWAVNSGLICGVGDSNEAIRVVPNRNIIDSEIEIIINRYINRYTN